MTNQKNIKLRKINDELYLGDGLVVLLAKEISSGVEQIGPKVFYYGIKIAFHPIPYGYSDESRIREFAKVVMIYGDIISS